MLVRNMHLLTSHKDVVNLFLSMEFRHSTSFHVTNVWLNI